MYSLDTFIMYVLAILIIDFALICTVMHAGFCFQLGRSSAIGAGELWMEPEDANIAQNVHQIVLQ